MPFRQKLCERSASKEEDMTTEFGTMRLREDSLASVRFERLYSGSPGQVWMALTSADRMSRWLGAAVDIDPQVGGSIRVSWSAENVMTGEITRYDEPHVLEFTWNEEWLGIASIVRFELRAEGSSTVLTLEHLGVPRAQAAGLGAGWHGHLDAIAAELLGQSLSPQARYETLRPEYAQRFA